MRHSLTCPKCQGRRFFEVAEVRTASHRDYSASKLVGLAHAKDPDGSSWDGTEAMQANLYAFVCARCGFAELSCRDLPVLEAMAAKGVGGVRVIDATPGSAGPHR